MRCGAAGCAALLQVLLQVLALRQVLGGVPYSCHVANNFMTYLSRRLASNSSPTPMTPNSTMVVGYRWATLFVPIAVITLFDESDPEVKYELTMNQIEKELRIEREQNPDVFDPPHNAQQAVPMPPDLLAMNTIRYFWVRAVALPNGAGEVSMGRAGQDAALITLKDPKFKAPNAYRFRPSINWVHNCSATPVTGFAASLGCRHLKAGPGGSHDPMPPTIPIEQEAVPWGNSSKAVRFLVKAERGYVTLSGVPSHVNYQIQLNALAGWRGGKIAIEKNGVVFGESASAQCRSCMSTSEFRLFTILFNDTRIEVYEGTTPEPIVSAPFLPAFQVTHVFYSASRIMSRVEWLHGCQGYEHTDGAPVESVTLPPVPTLPPATQGKALKEALGMADKCRVVHTFKYRFDSYFAISEEGLVSGSFSGLTFSVAGRRDVHLQLVPSIPPPADNVYEIDIGFHNYTNLDRGKEQKLASVRQHDLLSENELRSFTIRHDVVTGILNVTSADGQLQMAWRDPKPFPLRYFSICSGSSAGNETVWVFGCWNKREAKNSCSRPLVTYSYSHSQYFSLDREGVVNGTRRTIYVHLRASGSGHIRLEHALPPAVDALIEVDLSHEGSTSIDSLGRRVATVREPGLLSINELRGFWVTQDTATRRLEVGKIGTADPLVFWTAPPAAKFPELRVFSLATSRSVGNGTWFYGCKEGQKPEVDTIHAQPEAEVPDESEEYDLPDLPSLDYDVGPDSDEMLRPPAIGNRNRSTTANATLHSSSASLVAILHRNLSNYMLTQGTEFAVRLNVSVVSLDDFTGMMVIRGHILVMWQAVGLGWDPADYNNIKAFTHTDLAELLAPELHVPNGDVETGGLAYLHSSGTVRWEAPINAKAYCHGMDASRWPNDQHTCVMTLALSGPGTEGSTLVLMGEAKDAVVHARAARPLWHLVHSNLSASHEATNASSWSSSAAVSIAVTLRRNTPVMNRILIAPFVVLSALSMLAYWVQEPLPRDKVFLGCGSLLLLILSFLVFEAACPPGLIGIPLVLEVYCYASCLVAASVVVSAIVTAVARDVARDGAVRGPPLLLCRLLSVPVLRLVFNLTSDQVQQRIAEDELDPDGEEYRKGSSQLPTLELGSSSAEPTHFVHDALPTSKAERFFEWFGYRYTLVLVPINLHSVDAMTQHAVSRQQLRHGTIGLYYQLQLSGSYH